MAYLMAVWTEILGTEATPQDNFFDLGGHSMLAAKMANRVARETGHRVKLVPLATQTLAHVAMDIPASALPSPAAGDAPAASATASGSGRDHMAHTPADHEKLFQAVSKWMRSRFLD